MEEKLDWNLLEVFMGRSLLPLCAAACLAASFANSDVSAADRKPAAPAAPASSVANPVQAKDVPEMPEASLVAKVGRGGLTKQEFDWYQLRFANKAKKSVAQLSPEERRKALEEGIDDETLFQASIADGILNDSYTRFSMGSLYRSNKTLAGVDPRKFTDEELKAYYDAHPAEFSEPAANYVRVAKFNSKAEAADFCKKARKAKDPASLQGWLDLEWVSEGAQKAGLPTEITDKAAKLKQGQISDPVMDVMVKEIHYVFWASERKEAKPIPFEEAKGKVKFALVGQKQKDAQSALLKKLGFDPKKVSEEDALFFGALESGLHRDISVRQRCISTYVSKKGSTREQLLPALKKQFPATILEGAK